MLFSISRINRPRRSRYGRYGSTEAIRRWSSMYSKISITRSTGSYSDNIGRLRGALKAAEAVVVGAGAGLSTSAGFVYTGERFEKYFSDFAAKYGFRDMYSGGFYPFPEPEEFWAYWSRYIFINRYLDAPKPVYKELLALLKEKDYFVITTNVDHCFQKAGFDKQRLFYTQGDYGLFQCSGPCRQETYDNESSPADDGAAGEYAGSVGAASGLPVLQKTDDNEPPLRR